MQKRASEKDRNIHRREGKARDKHELDKTERETEKAHREIPSSWPLTNLVIKSNKRELSINFSM